MSGFRTAQTILRQVPGGYVDGVWISGAESTVIIQASVQPLRDSDIKMVTLPQGRLLQDIVRIYTNDELVTVEDKGDNQQPDKLVWRGTTYELSSRFDWQSGVISHFKYFATKVQLDADA